MLKFYRNLEEDNLNAIGPFALLFSIRLVAFKASSSLRSLYNEIRLLFEYIFLYIYYIWLISYYVMRSLLYESNF